MNYQNSNTYAEKTVGHVILMIFLKSGPMNLGQLRNHRAINLLSLDLSIQRLLTHGYLQPCDQGFELVGLPKHFLSDFAGADTAFYIEDELIVNVLLDYFFLLLEDDLNISIKPRQALAGPFAPCTQFTWQLVKAALKRHGLGEHIDPTFDDDFHGSSGVVA